MKLIKEQNNILNSKIYTNTEKQYCCRNKNQMPAARKMQRGKCIIRGEVKDEQKGKKNIRATGKDFKKICKSFAII